MKSAFEHNRRILVIDDNPAIHQDFQKILGQKHEVADDFEELESALFGKPIDKDSSPVSFELDFASQGQEGYQKVIEANKNNRPYAMAFVDMRMPPGWDGLETIIHLWRVAPDLQVVVCTAYSDHSWADITKRLGNSENLLILKKPFDCIEITQMATALCEKWYRTRLSTLTTEELERQVQLQTKDIQAAYDLSLHILRNVKWDWNSEEQVRALEVVEDLDQNAKAVSEYRKTQNLPEQRNSRRVPYRTPVTVFVRKQEQESDSTLFKCWSHNLSATGISFVINQQIPEKEIIIFLDSGSQQPIVCNGTIVRGRSIGEGLWEYGAKFAGRTFNSSLNSSQPKAKQPETAPEPEPEPAAV